MFRVATQLNLNELPRFLYLTRWCKDPDDTILARNFCEFYNISNDAVIINKNSQMAIEEDYQYLLKRTLYHLQRFIKAKPENTKHFYDTISIELDKKMSLNNDKNQNNNVISSVPNGSDRIGFDQNPIRSDPIQIRIRINLIQSELIRIKSDPIRSESE